MKPLASKFRENLAGVSKDVEETILSKPEKIQALTAYGDSTDDIISNVFNEKAVQANRARYGLIDTVKDNVSKIIQEEKLTGKSVPIGPILSEINAAERKLIPSGIALTPSIAAYQREILGLKASLIAYGKRAAGLADDLDEEIINLAGPVKQQIDPGAASAIKGINSALDKVKKRSELDPEIIPSLDRLNNLTKSKIDPKVQSVIERLKNYESVNNKFIDPAIAFGEKTAAKVKSKRPSGLRVTADQLNEIKTQYFKSADFNKQIGSASPLEQLYESLGAAANRELDSINQMIRVENSKIMRALNAQEKLRKFGLYERGEFSPEKLRLLATTNSKAFVDAKKYVAELDALWGTDLLETANLTRAYAALNPKDVLSRFQTGRSLLETGLGSIIGTAAGGPVGTVIGALGGLALSSPATTKLRIQAMNSAENLAGNILKRAPSLSPNTARFIPDNLVPYVAAKVAGLSTIERWNNSVDNQITKLSKHFLNEPKGAVERDGYDSLDSLRDNSFTKPYGGKEEDRVKAFQKRFDELSDYVTNPDKLSAVIARNTHYLSLIAPKVAEAMATKAALATQYLYSNAPKSSNISMIGTQPDYIPSDAALARFERTAAAVDNPLSILRSLGRGSVTREEVKAVKSVYPEIYSLILKSIQELADKKQLSYGQKIRLSTLFDMPLTNISKKNELASIQSTFQQENAPMSPPRSGKSISINNRETEAQRLERGLE